MGLTPVDSDVDCYTDLPVRQTRVAVPLLWRSGRRMLSKFALPGNAPEEAANVRTGFRKYEQEKEAVLRRRQRT